ncbi:MAG TPA: hypothetical protein VF029_04225 [Actinomycetota bacterium]
MSQPTLKKRFLGYSKESVEQLLNERDRALHAATEEARKAGTRVVELHQELDRLRRESEERSRQLEAAKKADTSTSLPSEGDLGQILATTERALAELFHEADRAAEVKVREIEQRRYRLQEDMRRLQAWRERVLTLTDDVRTSIEEARSEAAAASDRLRDAVGPATTAMEAVARTLTQLAKASEPPEVAARAVGSQTVIHLEEPEPESADEASRETGEAAARTIAPDPAQPPDIA